MSRTRTRNTDHSYYRAAERCGWFKAEAKQMMKNAQRYGKTWGVLPAGPLKDFLKKKQEANNRRIKYYNGYIFVFASTSTRCITVYKYEEVEREKKDDRSSKIN